MPCQAINWERIREVWIERHLAGETYTLKQLARDESVKYDTLKKRVSRGDHHRNSCGLTREESNGADWLQSD